MVAKKCINDGSKQYAKRTFDYVHVHQDNEQNWWGENNNLEKTTNTAFCFHRTCGNDESSTIISNINIMYSSLFLIINIIISSNQHNNNVV